MLSAVLAEVIGTFILVFVGAGTAVLMAMVDPTMPPQPARVSSQLSAGAVVF